MSFAFGFSGDDLESDSEHENFVHQPRAQIDDNETSLTPKTYKIQELVSK